MDSPQWAQKPLVALAWFRRRPEPGPGCATHKILLGQIKIKHPHQTVEKAPGKRRYKFHGGLSAGPKTMEGQASISVASF